MKKLMKKIFVLLIMAAFAASALPLFANAFDGQNTLEYEIEDKHCTVVFEDEIPETQKALIAKQLLGIEVETTESYGLLCTLFGHKYGEESGVDVITHKVRTSAPRCRRERYLVKICTRCEDMVSTLMSQDYIFCCPVD